jgi:hypothetical protein
MGDVGQETTRRKAETLTADLCFLLLDLRSAFQRFNIWNGQWSLGLIQLVALSFSEFGTVTGQWSVASARKTRLSPVKLLRDDRMQPIRPVWGSLGWEMVFHLCS